MPFLKVMLPPIIAFLVFAVFINFNPLAISFTGLSDIGDGSASGLITYFKIFAPFQFLIALLTQYLAVRPIWNRFAVQPKKEWTIFIGVILICLAMACGIGYTIWDTATGKGHLLHIILFMTGVQLLYWLINFAVLFLLDMKTLFAKPQPPGPLKGEQTNPVPPSGGEGA